MKKIYLLLLILMIFPYVVFADCLSDFKEIENEFKVSYKYNKDTDDFDITFVNPDKTKYTFGYHDKEEIKKFTMSIQDNQETLILKNYKDTKYEYNFVAISGNCANNVANSGTIELKKYNPYSDSPLCQGNEEFVLCQRDYDKAIDEESFKSRLEIYKQSKEIKENNSSSNQSNINKNNGKNSNKNNIFADILDFIKNNIALTIIILLVVIAIIVGIIFRIKKVIKSRRFE